MPSENTKNLPLITIASPKMPWSDKKWVDLSDHYPIEFQINDVKIVSYNLQFLYTLVVSHSGSEGFGKRSAIEICKTAKYIAKYFAQAEADICCVQELFDKKANRAMEKAMSELGYEASALLGAEGFFPELHAGIRIFIKKKSINALNTSTYLFKHKIALDSLVKKGVMELCFEKNNKRYRLYNTHLQATHYIKEAYYTEITLAQCVEIKRLIEEKQRNGDIQSDEEIIICGDFNIPKFSQGKQPLQQQENLVEDTFEHYNRLALLMGNAFRFLEYSRNETGPFQTVSDLNTNYLTPNLRRKISAKQWKYLQENPAVRIKDFLTLKSDLTLEQINLIKKTSFASVEKGENVLGKNINILAVFNNVIDRLYEKKGFNLDYAIWGGDISKKDFSSKMTITNINFLAKDCCDIQLAMANFIKTYASFFTLNRLSSYYLKKYNHFNEQFTKLVALGVSILKLHNYVKENIDKPIENRDEEVKVTTVTLEESIKEWTKQKNKLLNAITLSYKHKGFSFYVGRISTGVVLFPILLIALFGFTMMVLCVRLKDALSMKHIDSLMIKPEPILNGLSEEPQLAI